MKTMELRQDYAVGRRGGLGRFGTTTQRRIRGEGAGTWGVKIYQINTLGEAWWLMGGWIGVGNTHQSMLSLGGERGWGGIPIISMI